MADTVSAFGGIDIYVGNAGVWPADDVPLAEMSDDQWLRTMRENEAWRSIPVVVLTAKDITPEDHLRLQGNVRKVFRKASFSRDELIEEIRAAMEPRGSGPLESQSI